MAEKTNTAGFSQSAAIARSLVVYGIIAGPFYLALGILLGATREGFNFARHPLSLLMLGDDGTWQRANFYLTGLMVVAAAIGIIRAMRLSGFGKRAGWPLLVYGICLLLSGTFEPDGVDDFPPGEESTGASLFGTLHLAFGGIGFIALAVAAWLMAKWFSERGLGDLARFSRYCVYAIIAGFVLGAALAMFPIGVAALWVAVLAGWIWLFVVSTFIYRNLPHPDPRRR